MACVKFGLLKQRCRNPAIRLNLARVFFISVGFSLFHFSQVRSGSRFFLFLSTYTLHRGDCFPYIWTLISAIGPFLSPNLMSYWAFIWFALFSFFFLKPFNLCSGLPIKLWLIWSFSHKFVFFFFNKKFVSLSFFGLLEFV